MAVDVNFQSPPGLGPLTGKSKKGCPNSVQGCKKNARNCRVARAAVALLSSDQEMQRVRPLPARIPCGHLRSAIRSVFPDPTQVQELSIKTAQKLETEPCTFCASEKDEILRKYKEERFLAMPPVDEKHIDRFKLVLAVVLRRGWNRMESPYIPNGHASLFHTRGGGGTWNREPFSALCRPELVYSSGKPRVITMYSSYNSSVLSPLHDSLYTSMRRGGWLLVGSPTNEKVQNLNGDGPFVSVDYRSATDMIRAEYVRAAIQVLIDKSVGLTDEEAACLSVLGELRFVDSDFCPDFTKPGQLGGQGGQAAVRGQPMGSLMSFPLLCLINKACVDLALVDLLEAGKISMKKFTEHRCLINGDDLLYREFDDSLGIRDGVLRHGHAVGLVLNHEKTLVSPTVAEINSTVFVRGERRKKTNLAVLKRSTEVTDAIGFLADSVVKRRNFKKLLLSWAPCIAKQVSKLQGPLPPSFYSALWSVKDALCAVPRARPSKKNPFPIATKPAGYDLSRGDEVRYISERVARLMNEGYKPEKTVRCSTSFGEGQSIQCALRRKNPSVEDNILKVLADAWVRRTKEKLWLEDEPCAGLTTWAWGEESKVNLLVDALRGFQQRRRLMCATSDAGVTPRGSCAISRGDDYVEL